MKILVTGFCRVHISATRRRVKRHYLGDCFEDLARLNGHEVERRPVAPDERPDQWDAAFVLLGTPNVMGSSWAGSSLSLIHRSRRAVPVFDWWNIRATLSSLLAIGKRPGAGAGLAKVPGMEHADWIRKNGAMLEEWARGVAEQGMPLALTSFFPWGDHARTAALVPEVKELAWWDFSAAEPHYLGEGFVPLVEGRQRQWVTALHNGWAKYQWPALQWPLDRIGRAESRKAKLITEAEVASRYALSWGVLCPPNSDRKGDGWYRLPHVHAARAGAILLIDPDDAAGTGYEWAAKNHDTLEQMADAELAMVAREQRTWFGAHSWDEARLRAEFDAFVERVADR